MQLRMPCAWSGALPPPSTVCPLPLALPRHHSLEAGAITQCSHSASTACPDLPQVPPPMGTVPLRSPQPALPRAPPCRIRGAAVGCGWWRCLAVAPVPAAPRQPDPAPASRYPPCDPMATHAAVVPIFMMMQHLDCAYMLISHTAAPLCSHASALSARGPPPAIQICRLWISTCNACALMQLPPRCPSNL